MFTLNKNKGASKGFQADWQANAQAGAAPLIAVGILAAIFVGLVLFLSMAGGMAQPGSDASSFEDTGGAVPMDMASAAARGVFTDCVFYNKNPRVRSELSRDPNFIKSVSYYSKLLGYQTNDMISVFRIECDFNWHVVNAFGCGGMFQLCPISEKVTGITGRNLAKLSPANQMPYMYRYFKAMGCDRDPPATKTMTHAYLCVFLPAFRKVSPSKRIWPRGVNPLHDIDNNNWIYKWEVDCNMTSSYAIGSRSCGFNLPLCSGSKVLPRKQDY